MLEAMGCRTGIDVNALLALRERLAGWIEGEPMHGALWRAGLPATLPKNIIPMPSGIVTMPLPSGMNDRAVRKMTNMKKPSWMPAM